MRYKKTSVLLIAVCLMFNMTIVRAEENNDLRTEENMIQLYINGSTDIKVLDIDMELLQLEYDEISGDIESKRLKIITKKDKKESFKKKEGDSYEEAEEEYEQALINYASDKKKLENLKIDIDNLEKLKQDQMNKLKFEFKQQLWQYYTLQQQLELLKQSAELSLNQYDIAKLKLEMNTAIELEVKIAENNYKNLEIQVEMLSNNLKALESQIKIKLSIPLDQELNFKIEITPIKEGVNVSLDYVIQKFNENNIDIVKQDKDFEMEKFYFDTVAEAYDTKDKEYKDLELNYKKVELNKYNTDKNQSLALVNDYYTYTKAVDTLAVEQSNLSISQDNFNKNQKLFEVGQISELQYKGALNQYNSDKLKCDKAVIDYNIALMKLSNILQGIK